ncbi:helix-turn-helix transcriptional regulator [Endozoicomonas sp. SM1973]|uniref:Helix-turn-helix transcriptional regulator n=1 Tax=Spartinivicinus marinus TaxID=2994442 RepID=A0A853I160_9GAMM|nr:helix-turn-helix transcriptional regulator [Spartinivicinus marinus]MCX4029567.1 helix-turn-helix transcriptional regulator [Spartinivicinus marinus]NYZ65142.1 helix-turn-helix transcriptional regulator [Spartinivicinus marinus]
MQFSVFIQKHGDDEVAAMLGVKKRTVSSWRRMERAPTPEQAYNIIEKTQQVVDWQGIYQPYVTYRKRQKSKKQSMLTQHNTQQTTNKH